MTEDSLADYIIILVVTCGYGSIFTLIRHGLQHDWVIHSDVTLRFHL